MLNKGNETGMALSVGEETKQLKALSSNDRLIIIGSIIIAQISHDVKLVYSPM